MTAATVTELCPEPDAGSPDRLPPPLPPLSSQGPGPAAPVTVTVTVQLTVRGDDPEVVALLRELARHANDGAALPSAPVLPRPAAPAAPVPADPFAVGLDTRSRTAWRAAGEIALCRREFDLLLYLSTHPGQVFTRGQLLRAVWGDTFSGPRTVDVHVTRLRQKLRARRPVISTVRGVGYRLATGAPIHVLTAPRHVTGRAA
jgi:hypothetical protein